MKKKYNGLLYSFFLISVVLFLAPACKIDTPATIYDNTDEFAIDANNESIIDGTNATIEEDTEWKNLHNGDTIDYYIRSLVRVKNSAVLTIKPGVIVVFETTESGIRVEDNGGLNVSGEEDNHIIFKSRNQIQGAWRGIIFASNNASNILDYAEVYYAGSMIDEGYCDSVTAVGLASSKNAKASITNSKIEYSGGYGLWVAGTADVDLTFAKNTFSTCSGPTVAITANNISKLDSLSHYKQFHSMDYIEVYNSAGTEINNDDTIQRLNVPYRISGRVHVLKTLTISPGCILEFSTDGEITTSDISGLNHTGIIKAEGLAGDSIVFCGVEDVPVSWVGITITSPGNNSFLRCIISDGGASSGYQNPPEAKGNIIVGRARVGAKAIVMYSRISNSGGYGIAEFKDDLNPSNSSTVTTYFSIFAPTNKYQNNTLGNIGVYY